MDIYCPNKAHPGPKLMECREYEVRDEGTARERYWMRFVHKCGAEVELRIPCKFTMKR